VAGTGKKFAQLVRAQENNNNPHIMTQEPFKKDSFSESFPIKDVVEWTRDSTGGSRLFLTPIQRSVVWRNSQIINYWDSLLRGYPTGLMMVHRCKDEASQARTLGGDLCEVRAGDFQLFDGQQRLTAILLGLGEGQLKDRLKLWVDLGMDPSADSGLLFQLRVSSTGQPFGYQPQWPNEKPSISKRREKIDGWVEANNLPQFESQHAFIAVAGKDLIDAVYAVPLDDVISLLSKGEQPAIDELMRGVPPAKIESKIESFVRSLGAALKLPILFQLINQKLVEDGQEYKRFFGRLGQGGTALTNDELTYSIIKYHFPQVDKRMREITEGAAGQVAGEVNLVLAAVRVAKVSALGNASDDWQRPNPAFVSRLMEFSGVREEFQRMIPVDSGGRLKELLESIRQRLEYKETTNDSGLPVILLARLPHQLVDVLLLMESQRQPQEKQAQSLPVFVLYWLLFVVDSEKAANIIFKRFCLKEADWQPRSDKNLIRFFEKEGVSRRLPCLELLDEVRNEIQHGPKLLRVGKDRFVTLDANKDHPAGDALRVLSTDGELFRRALLWLQRKYLTKRFHNYDPTSSRDADLPIDLDHLIPHSKFGFNWSYRSSSLNFDDADENFRHRRGTVGNSLGNRRWLDAPDNRRRQDGKIEDCDGGRDIIEGVPDWNALIGKNPWGQDDVATFQKMIDLRTITIYEHLLITGGLKEYVTEPATTLVSSKP
jgi:hypothetical protein